MLAGGQGQARGSLEGESEINFDDWGSSGKEKKS